MIRIRCPNPKCRKPLGVKDSLAGRKVACPSCKKALVIPVPKAAPADLDQFATQALADAPKEEPKPQAAPQTVDFNCPNCDEELHLKAELAGTQYPCPECRRIIKVPALKVEKPKDWREVATKGAAAYLKTPKDELEGVQGDVRSKVSSVALKEAGAIEEPPPPPVGIGPRVKRIAWGVGSVTVVLLAIWGIYNARSGSTLKRTIQKAQLDAKSDKLTPLVRAEIQRGIGNLELRQGHRQAALEAYIQARALAQGEAKSDPVGHDLLLMNLALDQAELGGTEDDVLHSRRFAWGKVLEELKETVERIRAGEAQNWTARALGTKLSAVGKREMAVQLALGSRDPAKDPKVKMLQVAMILNTGDEGNIKFAHELLPPPDSKGRPLDMFTRAAYAEGYARQGKLEQALELVQKKGPAAERLEASLGVIWALGADNPTAAPFVAEALKAADELKKSTSPWSMLQLVRIAGSAGQDETLLNALVANLPAELQERGKLEIVCARARRQDVDVSALVDVRDKKSLWGQACFQLIRLGAQRGEKPPTTSGGGDDDTFKTILPLARRLGESDRARK